MSLRPLNMGTSGPDVKAVQQGLNIRRRQKPQLLENGVFDSNTDYAVRDFQDNSGLKVDGLVGHKTRKSLFPIGVCTLAVVGCRKPKLTSLWPQKQPALVSAGSVQWPPKSGRSASLSPGQLKLPNLQDMNRAICKGLCAPVFRPRKFWPLPLPVHAPDVPDWNFTVPAAAPNDSLGFVFDHIELQPGEQSTFAISQKPQNAIVFTLQTIYRRGPDDGAHQEAAIGLQAGTPISAMLWDGPWTFNPFIQLTDVDRFGKLGAFHYWQPYAQVGVQGTGTGLTQPSFAASVVPFNFGLDLGDHFTVGLGAGIALNVDLQSGKVSAGPQFSFGVSLKFGKPDDAL